MTLRPDGYVDRVTDPLIAEALDVFGAVVVEGPKWCGKTWSSLNQAESIFAVADPRNGFANRRLAQLDPSGALDGPTPRVVDEWQEVLGLWDAARFRLDESPVRGRYLFTGSATPADGTTMHSGAGRFGRVRMWPMSLLESGDSTGQISLSAVLADDDVRPTPGTATAARLAEVIVRGGWPDSRTFTAGQGQMLARTYLDTIARSEMTGLDGVRRDPLRVWSLLVSLARNTATPVSDATLRRDIAQSGPASSSASTVTSYLDALTRLFVLETIPAWAPGSRSRARLRVSPKRMLVDPSLSAAALGLMPAALLADLTTMGFLFEAMCLRDLTIYCAANHAEVRHYRDETGLEADAIVARPDGSWAGIEIKLGAGQADDAAAKLLALARKLTANGEPPPVALVVIVGVGGVAQRRDDGVYVIPVDLLAP